MNNQENQPICFNQNTCEPLYPTPEQAHIINLINEQNYDQLEQLLSNGLNPNTTFGAPDMLPHTCLLSKATRTGNINLVQLLLNRGADPNINVYDLPMNGAMESNNIDMAKLLIEHSNVFTGANGRFTPLQNLAGTYDDCSDELIKLIISHTADIEERTHCGLTALHFAVINDNINVVRHLIEAGANINSCTFDGKRPIDIAREKGFDQIGKLLESQHIIMKIQGLPAGNQLDLTPDQYNIIQLIKQNQCEQLGQLLQDGFNPNVIIKNKTIESTPMNMTCFLSFAIEAGHIDMVKLLLEFGADPNINVFDSPVYCAIQHKHADILKMLIGHGANMNEIRPYTSSGEHTPLHRVATWVDAPDDLIELVIGHVDNVNRQTFMKDTALHFAALNNNPRMVKHLIDAGADVHVKNSRGMTALDIARGEGFGAIVGLIETCD